MKAPHRIVAVLTLFVTAPIWYYLTYRILVAVNATELMMFLFWIYVPVGILCSFLERIAKGEAKP